MRPICDKVLGRGASSKYGSWAIWGRTWELLRYAQSQTLRIRNSGKGPSNLSLTRPPADSDVLSSLRSPWAKALWHRPPYREWPQTDVHKACPDFSPQWGGLSKHRQAYLGVFHHTLNAVKVREVTNRFIRIVQHPLDRLQKENTTSRQML